MARLGNRESESLGGIAEGLSGRVRGGGVRIQHAHAGDLRRKNPDAIQRILSSGVKLRWFPKEILDVAYDTTISMLEEISSKDADFKAIYQHYRNFMNKQSSWYRVADHFPTAIRCRGVDAEAERSL